MTMASFDCSSPTTEQLHCSGPTGKISWIIFPSYHEGVTISSTAGPLESGWFVQYTSPTRSRKVCGHVDRGRSQIGEGYGPRTVRDASRAAHPVTGFQRL